MHRTGGRSSEGFAVASALLIVLLLAGFSIGMIYQVNLETHLIASDLENNPTYSIWSGWMTLKNGASGPSR